MSKFSVFTEDNIRENRHTRKRSGEANQQKAGSGAVDLCCECLEAEGKWSMVCGDTHWPAWGKGPPSRSSAPGPSGRAGNQCLWPGRGWWKIEQESEKCLFGPLGQSPGWRGHLLHLLAPCPESQKCWKEGVRVNRATLRQRVIQFLWLWEKLSFLWT